MSAVFLPAKHSPYSREIIAAQRAGKPLNVHIHIGATAWARASRWGIGYRMVVPLDSAYAPCGFDFGFLHGEAVTINAIDADLVLARQVAVAIVERGATLAVLLHPSLPKWAEFIYRESL
jgi:hypothetical protein